MRQDLVQIKLKQTTAITKTYSTYSKIYMTLQHLFLGKLQELNAKATQN